VLENPAAARADAPPLTLNDPPAGVTVVDLGGADIDRTGVAVRVLDTTSTITVVAVVDDDSHVIVDRVQDGAGADLVDPDPVDDASPSAERLARGFTGPFFSPDRMLPSEGGGAFVLGAHPALPRTEGQWTVGLAQARVSIDAAGAVLQQEASGPARLAVVIDDRARAGRLVLPLVMHFTGARGLTAATAADSPVVQAIQSTVQATFAAADIDVVFEESVDVVANAVVDLRPGLCDGGGLRTLLRTLPTTPAALDVVFVERLRCEARGVVIEGFAGLAGAIPADAFADTGTGGVALALAVIEDDPARAGVIAAHEIGHALGLLHVMEFASGADPLVFDTLPDTLDDPRFEDNLMVAAPTTSTSLTTQQIAQLRASPWLSP